MAEKRFENRLNKDDIKFNTQNPVWDNEICDALNVFDMIDLLNEQHDRIKWLEERVSQLECLLELDKLHKEVEEGKMNKFVEWRCE